MTKGYLFRGKSVSFEEAFPDIEEIKIEGTEGDIAQKHNILLNKDNWGISCSNSLCKDKGYSVKLGDFISEMYRNQETSKEGIISCGGYESMGRGKTRRCLNHLKVKVEIKYKRCPKCKIDIKNEDFRSVKERHLGVLLADKKRMELDGNYKEIVSEEDCNLCGAIKEDIITQVKKDILDNL